MGAYMTIQIEAKNKDFRKVNKAMKDFGAKQIGHYHDDEKTWLNATYNAYYHGWWGYAEPTEFYREHKDIFLDIWCLDLSCADCNVGRHHPDRWWSCKQELVEDV